MKTDKTICLNSKVGGVQPSLQDRIYDVEGCSTAITTSFLPSIAQPFIVAMRKKYKSHEIEMNANLAVPNSTTHRERVGKQMANTLDTGCQQGVVEKENNVRYRIRKLTPRECFRLMGVDDADIDKLMNASISNSQLYKCAGNSIVVDVLYHLFRKLFVDKGCEQENFQQTLF